MVFREFRFSFQVNLRSHYFCDFQKKGPRAIYKDESDKTRKCLSVGNFGILFVVDVCGL